MSHAAVKPDSEAQLGDWMLDIGSSGLDSRDDREPAK